MPEMIVAITLLLAGLVLPVSVWTRGGGPADAPPIDAVGQVREVNRIQKRLVLADGPQHRRATCGSSPGSSEAVKSGYSSRSRWGRC